MANVSSFKSFSISDLAICNKQTEVNTFSVVTQYLVTNWLDHCFWAPLISRHLCELLKELRHRFSVASL